jgi:copper chaperone CopZ
MKLIAFLLLLLPLDAAAAERSVQYSVRGLFQPDRKAVLINAAKALENCSLVGVDYETARATFTYDDEAQSFKKAGPEQILRQIDNQIRTLTDSTFTLLPPSNLPEAGLKRIDFTIEGLDCLGCSYGAYRAIVALEGVERATASFRDAKLTAFIDPAKTSRETLAEALKKREIKIVEAASTQELPPKK